MFCLLFTENQFISLTQISQISRRALAIARACHPAELSSKLHSSEELKFLSSQPTLIRVGGNADKRGRSDAPFVRFVRSVWDSIICARVFWCVCPDNAKESDLQFPYKILTITDYVSRTYNKPQITRDFTDYSFSYRQRIITDYTDYSDSGFVRLPWEYSPCEKSVWQVNMW